MRRWSLLTAVMMVLVALSSFAPVVAEEATPVASPEASPEASPVAPAKVRGAQPQRNMEAFFDAFAIEPGDPVYLAPEDRIVIW